MLMAVCSCENCVIQGGHLTRSVSGICWSEYYERQADVETMRAGSMKLSQKISREGFMCRYPP